MTKDYMICSRLDSVDTVGEVIAVTLGSPQPRSDRGNV